MKAEVGTSGTTQVVVARKWGVAKLKDGILEPMRVTGGHLSDPLSKSLCAQILIIGWTYTN